MTQPHTMTAGPPLICGPSKKGFTAYSLVGTYHAQGKQEGDTPSDTNDRERDTKVLSGGLLKHVYKFSNFRDSFT